MKPTTFYTFLSSDYKENISFNCCKLRDNKSLAYFSYKCVYLSIHDKLKPDL